MPQRFSSNDTSASGRFASFLLFLVFGAVVFLPAMPFSANIADGPELILRLITITLFLCGFFWLRKSTGLEDLDTLFLAFAVASAAMLLSWQYGGFLYQGVEADLSTMRGIALAKTGSAIMHLLPFIIFMPFLTARGDDFYWRIGARGIIAIGIGILAFGGFALAAFGSLEAIGDLKGLVWWILLFVAANAVMEEILFRGLFLSNAVRLMGRPLAVIATALVFAGAHLTITYFAEIATFLIILVALGILWAVLMLWSRSIWGSVVFHAGSDLMIVAGIVQTMQ